MEVWDADPHNPEMGSWLVYLLCDPGQGVPSLSGTERCGRARWQLEGGFG